MFFIPLFDDVGSPWLVLVFGGLLLLQWSRPLRRLRFSLFRRVVRNIAFAVPALLTLRLALLPVPLLAAAWAERNGFGLIHWLLPAEGPIRWVGLGLGIPAFDYAYYWWHYATHKVPLLWRFHNVHHTDLDMDVSTALRFHFGELILSILFRAATVVLFGIGFWTAVVYEIVFETAGQFHHSNWRLPKPVERLLNAVFVTPRMHGIHHSIVRDEFNSNWGTLFSFWDRLHGTHRLDIPQEELILGVPAYRDENELTPGRLLGMPFRKQRDWKLPDGRPCETRRDAPSRKNG
ncbi:sterol desaturase family protein [Larkinella soli]|uniref:sterol desaturase family protein n=1 Tax=Larkinella soli TaxID=1770527 RepID=UPI000FFC5080|nr:sterol desaturase family protein [Larkinella soli]